MKLPITWLKDYVDFDDTAEGLAEKLTFSGIEVEAIDTFGSDYAGMVVGYVTAVEKHPDADRLTLCVVHDGKNDHRVVCGAPNVREGIKAAFAPVGSVLADGTKLKKAKIRGVESFGMLCAEDEIGLSENHDGILILDDQAEAGTPLAEVLGPPETVLDLEITPNRPDCLCMIGVAREVATLYGSQLKIPSVQLKNDETRVDDLANVVVEDAEGCPRYTAQVLHNVQIKSAPSWMQKRLHLAGIRPINNVVDITNYVMLETGQPLHAFDHALLKDATIVVRRAKKKEKMTTLDGIERELSTDTLLISDKSRAVAVAGVMGGAGSEIHDDTQTVLLESACFKPADVKAASKLLGLSSESSYRFERGVDQTRVGWCSERAAALMVEYADATVSIGLIDAQAAPLEERQVPCRYGRVRSILGVQVSDEEIRDIFVRLGLQTKEVDADWCEVIIPAFRSDITREVDLIEEVARIHGLNQIPAPPPLARIAPDADDSAVQAKEQLRKQLVALGLQEIVNYTLVSDKLLDKFDPDRSTARVEVAHPLSQDQSIMRPSLIPQLVDTLGKNHARQVHDAAFFELGRTYSGKNEETERISIGLIGSVGRTGFHKDSATDEETFLWLKGLWEALAATQDVAANLAAKEHDFLQEGYSLTIQTDGSNIGVLGLLKPSIKSDWRLSGPLAVLEVDVEPLIAGFGKIGELADVPAYPAITRDMALLVDKQLKHRQIVDVLQEHAPEELKHVKLFDIFEGETIGPDKKSMAYSLTYRSAERTLTDEEANVFHENLKGKLKSLLGIDVREG